MTKLQERYRIKTHAECLAEVLAAKQAEYDALSQDQRQLILDCMNVGFTIGQAMEWVGVSMDAVCGVIEHNIADFKYLRSEAVTA